MRTFVIVLPPNDDIFYDFYVFKTSGDGTLELLLSVRGKLTMLFVILSRCHRLLESPTVLLAPANFSFKRIKNILLNHWP